MGFTDSTLQSTMHGYTSAGRTQCGTQEPYQKVYVQPIVWDIQVGDQRLLALLRQ